MLWSAPMNAIEAGLIAAGAGVAFVHYILPLVMT